MAVPHDQIAAASSALGELAGTSENATWTCTGGPCPWGDSLANPAIAWPASDGPVATRLGYTVSPAVYLPAATANGLMVAIDSGTAGVYAGAPQASSHRLLVALSAGDRYPVSGLADGEVLSVQSADPFDYQVMATGDAGSGGTADAIGSRQALWRCTTPDCAGDDWTGAVIAWPDWAAYQSNSRSGDQSRSVFATDGTPLHPYMGSWAQGCEVTCVSGTALIIEWQRGTDVWRETQLLPGQSHVIDLVPPEDGAMIETLAGYPDFSVSLASCTPQPLP